MKFGMPTLIETKNLEECITLCKHLRLDFIELNMNMPEYQINQIDVKKIIEIHQNENIFFTIHLDENLNVADFNPLVAKAYMDTVKSTIQLAKQIGTPILNMHMSEGVYFTLPDKKVYLFEYYQDAYINRLSKFRDMCENEIGQENIKICIENTDGFKKFSKTGIEFLLESPVFALTYDVGHDNCIGYKDEEFIKKHIKRLVHIHLHDALEKKNHLPLGEGNVNIQEMLNLAKERNCNVVLETKTIKGLIQSVNKLSIYNCEY